MASWLRNFKHLNQCDKYLASLAELFTIVSRFVGLVNPVFGTSAVESVNVRTQVFIYPFCDTANNSRAYRLPFSVGITGHRLRGAVQGIQRRTYDMEGRHR